MPSKVFKTRLWLVGLFFWAAPVYAAPTIAVSLPYLKDVVENLFCKNPTIQVESLVPYGADPHSFAPTFATAKLLERTPLALGLGGGLDRSLLKNNHLHEGQNLFFVAPRNAATDLHIWQSVGQTLALVRILVPVLQKQGLPVPRRCVTAYVSLLSQTQQQIQIILNAVPAAQRVLVVPHNAFGFFTQTYGWTQMPLSTSVSEEETYDWKRLQTVIGFLQKDPSVHAVFTEYGTNDNAIKQVARSTHTHLAGPLYSDNLMATGPAHTLTGLWTTNAQTIAKALKDNK